jgi:hypothetical protein
LIERYTRTATVTEIRWNDNIYSTPDDIRNGFYQYFQALAIPPEDYMFDASFISSGTILVLIISLKVANMYFDTDFPHIVCVLLISLIYPELFHDSSL